MSCQCFVSSQCEFADQTGRKGEDIDMFAERTLVIREEKEGLGTIDWWDCTPSKE